MFIEAVGLPLGTAMNVSIDIRINTSRADNTTSYAFPYTLTATVGYLSTPSNVAAHAWPERPAESWVKLPLVVRPANATTDQLVTTAHEDNNRYWNAIAAAASVENPTSVAPQNVSIVHGYHGHDDVDGWATAATTLRLLGGNGLRVYPSQSLGVVLGRSMMSTTPTTVVPHLPSPSSHHDVSSLPFVALMGSTMPGFGPGLSGNATWWGATQADVDANLTHWAQGIIGPLANAGFSRGLSQLALHDEPGWHFPANRNTSMGHAPGSTGWFGFRFDLPPEQRQYQLDRYL